MKEIKAYIRPTFLDSTIEHLEKEGAKDITVIRVDALGELADFEYDRRHIIRKYSEKYSKVVKLEIVCQDHEAEKFMRIIKEYAYFGEHGDGRVFLSPILRAINIRTGEEDEAAL
jgi:nitrogen regulatory protein P-II 1